MLSARGGTVRRLLHVDGRPAVVGASQPAADRVCFAARADTRSDAEYAISRLRFALGVDDDLRPFHERFCDDPMLGPLLRRDATRRTRRRPEPFEALAWAICGQLIEFQRAAAIQRRIVARFGRRCPQTGLRDVPDAARVAALAPAELEALDLSGPRAITLVRAAREVASGRVDLYDGDHEAGWRRLRAIHGIGAWTLEVLAVQGQGRLDQLPAGDLAYLKLVGRLTSRDPRTRVAEAGVRAFFAPYEPWAGLAGEYVLAAAGRGLAITPPARAGTRSSTRRPRPVRG